MKNVFAILLFIISFSYTNAQENEKESLSIFDKKHEVRLGVVKALSGGIIEGVYEYVQDSNRGFGAAILLNLDSNNSYPENYSLTPFYRMYFQTNEDFGAKGFFVEGFSSFFGGKNYTDTLIGSNYVEKTDNFFDISIGIALGKKWINTAGFIFEIKAGAGRNLLGTSNIEALFKGDFYIGYRF